MDSNTNESNDDDEDSAADDSMFLPPPMINLSQGTHECPYCHILYAPLDLILHLRENHPLTLSLWIANSISTSTMADTIALLLNGPSFEAIEEETEAELETYEYWMNLEEIMGYHEVGVADINAVAPLDPTTVQTMCPICLEDIEEDFELGSRTIKACSHTYCSPCLETWLSKKKVCPVCRTECS